VDIMAQKVAVNMEDVDFNELISFLRKRLIEECLRGRIWSSMIVSFSWLTENVSVFLNIPKHNKKGDISESVVEALKLLKAVELITVEKRAYNALGDLGTWRLVMRDKVIISG
jgi:hypothetical protein